METAAAAASAPPEVSVVIPCLDEADTIAACIEKCRQAFETHGIVGEVIAADNGSVDRSAEIASAAGARVVHVASRGYGSALMGGIASATAPFVIMGDADDSYDFREIPRFVERLRQGFDLVQGCRLPAGGGALRPGAMPFFHRWVGNPVFSLMARLWFRAPVHDAYCGMRGFTKEAYRRLDLRCTGMEFAVEMIVKASLYRLRIAEVPITLHPDGRRAHPPHLRTLRDGWRTLRFLLMYSPRWLFFVPGAALVLAGIVGYILALPAVRIAGATLDAHTLLFASLAILCGAQALAFAVFAKTFAISEGLIPRDPRLERAYELVTLERGVAIGLGMLLVGLSLLGAAVVIWWDAGFGHLNYAHTMRIVIPGATLTALGFQVLLSSFMLSILRLRRR